MKKLLSFFLFLSGALNAMERKPQPSFTTDEQGLNALAFVAAANTALVRPIADGLFAANPHMTRQDIVRYYERPDQQGGTEYRSVLPVLMVHAICAEYRKLLAFAARNCFNQAVEYVRRKVTSTGQLSLRSPAYGIDMFSLVRDPYGDLGLSFPLAYLVAYLEKILWGGPFVYTTGSIMIHQGTCTEEDKRQLHTDLLARLNEHREVTKRINFLAVMRDGNSKCDMIIRYDESYIVIIDTTTPDHPQVFRPETGAVMTAIDENRFRIFDTISDTIEFVIARAAR